MRNLLLIISLLTVATSYGANDLKTIFKQEQIHNSGYLPSEKDQPKYLDNNLLVRQLTNSKEMDIEQLSDTQNRTYYVNCASERQKKNAAVAEKFLYNFYNWEWAELLFQLDENSKVYFQMVDGINAEDGKCPGMPPLAPCPKSDGRYNGRLSYLNVIHFFKLTHIDRDYRIGIKKTECISEDLVHINATVNGSAVSRDPKLNGKVVRKVWYDTPVSYQFQITKEGKVAMEHIFTPASFVPNLGARILADEALLDTPTDDFPEIDPKVRKQFEKKIIDTLNSKLINAK